MSCISAVSDDGVGNYMLGFESGNGPDYPGWAFFTIRDGVATEVGGRAGSGEGSGNWSWGQPSGFTLFRADQYGGSSASFFDHGGAGLRTVQIAHSSQTEFFDDQRGVAAIDPNGGLAVVRNLRIDGVWTFNYLHLDKTGLVDVPERRVAGSGAQIVRAGVSLTGEFVLLAAPTDGSGFVAKWLSRTADELTGWFPVPIPTSAGDFDLLAGSGLVWRDIADTLIYFPDGQAAIGDAPAWLRARPHARFNLVEGGRAYAVNDAAGQCAGLEIVASSSGKSCGCVALGKNGRTTVGRDGSVMVPEDIGNGCRYLLYPQLLK